jgi:hypothetical protein
VSSRGEVVGRPDHPDGVDQRPQVLPAGPSRRLDPLVSSTRPGNLGWRTARRPPEKAVRPASPPLDWSRPVVEVGGGVRPRSTTYPGGTSRVASALGQDEPFWPTPRTAATAAGNHLLS